MFGSDIIFAPILNEGQTEREVYLPKGKWILTNGKKEYEGEQTVFCHAELNEFIAFVKAGSEILKEFT